jgi:PAS domain-containing protein
VRLTRVSESGLLNAFFWDIFKDAPVSFIELNKSVKNNSPVRYEEFFPGIKCWIEVTAYPYDEALTLFFKDITDKKNAEQKIRTGNERYELVNKATNDAIYDWDIINDRLDWGGGFERLFGYSTCLSTLKEWATRVHPEDLKINSDSLDVTLADKDALYWRGAYRFRKICGTYAHITEDGYIIRDETGKAVRMVGALHDISNVKENEERVLAQNKLLKEIAQINSHQIRKPVANILGILDLLDNTPACDFPEWLEVLKKCGVELDEIVREIAKKAFV